jgi:hypothetical protein
MDARRKYLRFGEPRFARFLFASTAAAWIWLPDPSTSPGRRRSVPRADARTAPTGG